jgi:peptidoglycan-N-acetylglucosamine deacetylase
MNTPTTLSVLVPAYNEQYLVYASLERLKILAESPLLERIEVIVVDDGSTDQTASILRDFQRSISAELNAKMKWVFLRHEVNQGKAAAIRTALHQATAELSKSFLYEPL